MRHSLFALCVATALTACTAPIIVPIPIVVPIPASAVQTNVQDFAKAVLNDLQPASFAQEREFCGWIYTTPSGALASTQANAGTVDFCDYGFAPDGTVASFHTHGNYLPSYDSEVPSVNDQQASIDTGIDDYLATPGGRFWRIDADGTSIQLCGLGCVTSDPDFIDDAD